MCELRQRNQRHSRTRIHQMTEFVIRIQVQVDGIRTPCLSAKRGFEQLNAFQSHSGQRKHARVLQRHRGISITHSQVPSQHLHIRQGTLSNCIIGRIAKNEWIVYERLGFRSRRRSGSISGENRPLRQMIHIHLRIVSTPLNELKLVRAVRNHVVHNKSPRLRLLRPHDVASLVQ